MRAGLSLAPLQEIRIKSRAAAEKQASKDARLSVQFGMGYQIIIVAVFLLLVALGWLWSMAERHKAVQDAYDEIRKQVKRERSNMGHS